MKDTILEILEEIRSDIDYEKEDQLITDHIFESFDIVALIARLTEEFDISIRSRDLIPDNFDSYTAICSLVERLMEE